MHFEIDTRFTIGDFVTDGEFTGHITGIALVRVGSLIAIEYTIELNFPGHFEHRPTMKRTESKLTLAVGKAHQ